jgi:U5 small nuclear ribonucleoprotein component
LLTVEFGNYIGADLDSDDEIDASPPGPSNWAPLPGLDDDGDLDMEGDQLELNEQQIATLDSAGAASNQIILHEDKKYYSTAEEVYGTEVETMVQEEDAQLLTEPIIAPVKQRSFMVQEKNLPVTRYDKK